MPETLEIDLARREIRRGGEAVATQRRVFDLIAHLYANRGRAVPRDELLEEVWSDVTVSEASLAQAVRSARQALGDDADAPRFIETVRGYGYRWVDQPAHAAAPVAPQETRRESKRPAEGQHCCLYVVLPADVDPRVHVASELEEIHVGRSSSGAVADATHGHLVLRFPSDTLSRRHSLFVRTTAGWFFEDVGSKNGSYVGWRRASRVELRDGDWIRCGGLLMRWRSGDPCVAPGCGVTVLPDLTRSIQQAAGLVRRGKKVAVGGPAGVDRSAFAAAVASLAEAPRSRVELTDGAADGDLRVPPLRERMEDLGLWVARLDAQAGRSPTSIEPEAIELFAEHDWPGNEAELGRLLEAARAETPGAITRELAASLLGPVDG